LSDSDESSLLLDFTETGGRSPPSTNPHKSPYYIKAHPKPEDNGPDRKQQGRHFRIKGFFDRAGREKSSFQKYQLPCPLIGQDIGLFFHSSAE
jgi:hypothetical protein